MRCSAFLAMQNAFEEPAIDDPVVQRFLVDRKQRVLDDLKRLVASPADLEALQCGKPCELAESEIRKLKTQLEALRGAELRRVLPMLVGNAVGGSGQGKVEGELPMQVEGELPMQVELMKLPTETLRRIMFEIQKMQEEDYVACEEWGWN